MQIKTKQFINNEKYIGRYKITTPQQVKKTKNYENNINTGSDNNASAKVTFLQPLKM